MSPIIFASVSNSMVNYEPISFTGPGSTNVNNAPLLHVNDARASPDADTIGDVVSDPLSLPITHIYAPNGTTGKREQREKKMERRMSGFASLRSRLSTMVTNPFGAGIVKKDVGDSGNTAPMKKKSVNRNSSADDVFAAGDGVDSWIGKRLSVSLRRSVGTKPASSRDGESNQASGDMLDVPAVGRGGRERRRSSFIPTRAGSTYGPGITYDINTTETPGANTNAVAPTPPPHPPPTNNRRASMLSTMGRRLSSPFATIDRSEEALGGTMERRKLKKKQPDRPTLLGINRSGSSLVNAGGEAGSVARGHVLLT